MKTCQFIFTEQGSNKTLSVSPELILVTNVSDSEILNDIKSSKQVINTMFEDLGIQAFKSALAMLSVLSETPFMIIVGTGYMIAHTNNKNVIIEIHINDLLIGSIPIIVNKC